ncbi:MAG: TetR/AcrR family transcriptional regulator [Actinomycetes bacterium]
MSEGTEADHRARPRRRGPALRSAILQAALAELQEVGYAGLTMERVAERARTGKASVYRQWPTRLELALDAIRTTFPEPADAPDTGSLRGDLLALLRWAADLLRGPSGEALRGLLGEALADNDRLRQLRHRTHGGGRETMRAVALRAVERGEMAPEMVTSPRLDVGQALLRQYFLFEGSLIPDDLIVAIVDEVVLPLWTGGTAGETAAASR